MNNPQKTLSQDQITAFYHDLFVESQVKDFIKLTENFEKTNLEKIIDIGGGCGFFAKALKDNIRANVTVLDSDHQSINFCKQTGINAIHSDALKPIICGDEKIVCFNLILHHLVGSNDQETYKLQSQALLAWHSTANVIFINEYIYESFAINNFSGWLIYQITSSSVLSFLCNLVAKFIPSLKANTFGVGVRFRSHTEWLTMFESLGFKVINTKIGIEEHVSLPRRMLLIKSCRRDSFLLKPIFQKS